MSTTRHHLRGAVAALTFLAVLVALLAARAAPAAAYDRLDQATSFESSNFPGRYVRHRHFLGEVSPLTSNGDRNDATFLVRRGLNGVAGSVSFESANFPGRFLRHQDFRIKLAPRDGTDTFSRDASFVPRRSHHAAQWRYESANFPGHFVRHQNFELWLHRDDGSGWFHNDSSWRGLPAAPHCAGADTVASASTTATVEAAITCLTNQERVARGLGALAVNATLTGTARTHSQDMVRRRYFSHDTPEGVTPCRRLSNAGYRYSWCGENIAWASPATANGLMSQWMTSDGHRANILDGNFAEIGVGVAAGTPTGSTSGATATQNFGRRG